MNKKQYDITEKSLRGLLYKDMTPEQLQLRKEVSACGMIISLLAYNYTSPNYTAKDILEKERNSYHNYLGDHEKALGETRLLELIQDLLEDRLDVRCGVFTDSEGCTYNSVHFKSEVTA